MIITIGEVVTDHFPEYRRIGGAPLNFACHMKKFGEEVCLITRVGNDADGNDIRKMIRDHGLSIKRVQIDQTHPTGRVNVTLDPQGVPSFDIAEDAAYDWIDLSPSITGEIPAAARLIYFGSLIQRSPHGFEHVRSFLERRPSSARCFCDINFRPPHISGMLLNILSIARTSSNSTRRNYRSSEACWALLERPRILSGI